MVLKILETPYACRRVNPSTFLIIHDDKYGDHPFIYVKISTEGDPHPTLLLDTGCGVAAARSKPLQLKDLKDFLYNFPVAENGGRPLISLGPKPSRESDAVINRTRIIIVNTHCHYDHIGGNESFDQDPDVQICVSNEDPSFVDDRPRAHPGEPTPRFINSLCGNVGMKLPKYTIDRFLEDDHPLWHGEGKGNATQHRSADDKSVMPIATPGHTPDSLSLYDRAERVLYVGDLFYRRKCILPGRRAFRQAIEFPAAGDWNEYMRSLYHLRAYIEAEQGQSEQEIVISCSHTTAQAPAFELLNAVIALFEAIISGAIQHKKTYPKDGEIYKLWESDGEDPDLSVEAPARLLREVSSRTHSLICSQQQMLITKPLPL